MAPLDIPVIDVPPSKKLDDMAQELQDVIATVGFLHLTLRSLDISQDEVNDVFRVHKALYESPLSERAAHPFSTEHRNGYKGLSESQLAEKAGAAGDYRESYVFGHFRAPSTSPDQPLPPVLEQNKATLEAFHRKAHAAVCRILDALSVSLNMPKEYFSERHSLGMNSISLINYPALPAEAAKTDIPRAGAHKDWGSITLLFQEEKGVPGLEVLMPDSDQTVRAGDGRLVLASEANASITGTWVKAPVVPGTVLVNVGLALEAWTGGLLRATMHRVILPEPNEDGSIPARRSMTMFTQPCDDVVFNPISKTGVVTMQTGALTSKEFFRQRMAATDVKAY